jgi:hypothetical protein
VRILLDECLPDELSDELTGTVQSEGWKGLKNGELLRRAADTFDAFLTVDTHIESTHRLTGDLAVITIRSRSNRIQDLLPRVPAILQALQDLRPGTFVTVARSGTNVP